LLISPLSALECVLGYVVAGVVRAFVVAALITLLGLVLVHALPKNWPLYVLVIAAVAVLFASLGVVFGLFANKFDDIASLNTFVIQPLVFVGGVFTSLQLLSPTLRAASVFNPMFHMIDAFRYAYTGTSDVPVWISLTVVGGLTVAAFSLALRLWSVGYKLRT
jgi:ABC-2 type transport system permease protein